MGAPLLTDAQWDELKPTIHEWQRLIIDGVDQLKRIFKFETYAQALAFTNNVAKFAEEQGHHPAIVLEWGKVEIRWWTHKINGLHHNDVIMAAKTDAVFLSVS